MSWPTVFRPEAEVEMEEAFTWYQSKRDGLGREFAECIQKVLDRIAANPEVHPKVYHEIREAIVRRFPYVIYYQVSGDEVVIVSVFHSKRNPDIWKKRVLDNGD